MSTGHSVIDDITDERLTLLRRLDQLRFVAEPAFLAATDVILLAVPTPLRDGVPDLTAVEGAAALVGAQLQPGTLVVLESTTYPGTTEEVLLPISSASRDSWPELIFFSPMRRTNQPGRRARDAVGAPRGRGYQPREH